MRRGVGGGRSLSTVPPAFIGCPAIGLAPRLKIDSRTSLGWPMPALSNTAALVMHWARPLYPSGSAGRYMAALDLSAAGDLVDTCDGICPWYGEVILNRKHLIRKWADHWLSEEGNDQAVILASGVAPLSMELLDGHRNARVVEIDTDGMAQKRCAYQELVPHVMDRIEFLELDIRSRNLVEDIRSEASWFDPRRPTLVVLEGITYYISRDDLAAILSGFAGGRNRAVLEYLVPEGAVDEDRRAIPAGIFEAIGKAAGVPSFSRYTKDDICSLAESIGGSLVDDVPMSRMESVRTGANRFFSDARSGWIRCAALRL